jgi:hypothetical protein
LGLSDATTGNGIGVKGIANSAAGSGVYGINSSGIGVYGTSNGTGDGVYGENGSFAANVNGIHGVISSISAGGTSAGVKGENLATNSGGYGVYGSHAGSGPGIYGTSATGNGVSGYTLSTANGVFGYSSGGNGVSGSSSTGNAGHFLGDVIVTGRLQLDTLGTGGATALCYNGSNRIATCSSSLRYKTDLKPFTGGLEILSRLKPISFTWKTQPLRDLGLGAEEVAAVEPLLVTHNAAGEIEGVKYDRINIVLINAVREQQAQIDAERDQIARQQSQLKSQQDEIAALKSLICAGHAESAACKSGP